MKTQILNRFTGKVIVESDDKSLRQLLIDSIQSDADLSGANLSGADLRRADLSDADLRRADLSDADLSDAKNLKTAADFLAELEQDELGFIVYKRIGAGTPYTVPDRWKIEPGAFLTDTPNPTKTNECGCGVNFGTLKYCQKNSTNAQLWKCRIRFIDLADVVVPFGTDGKARCARLELLEAL